MIRKGPSVDPDILASHPALRRAARRAHKLAQATRSPIYILHKGRVVNLNASARREKRGTAERA